MASYKRATYDKAVEIATDYYDNFLSLGAYPGELRALPREREQAIDSLASQYLPIIRSVYKEDAWDAAQEDELSKFPVKKGVHWVNGVGPDPKSDFEEHKFSEFRKLVEHNGDSTLGAWYNMPQKKLDKVMKDLRYNPYDKESRKQFYKDLAEHDKAYNRMKAVQSTGAGWLLTNALLNPSAFDEAMKQSLDPNAEADPGKVYDKFIIDQLSNATIGLATRGGSLPSLMLGTAGGEFERQALNKYMYPEDEFKFGPIVATPVAAAITSGGVRGVGRLASRIRFPGFQGFGRGMMKGARGANELEAQKEALKRMLIDTRAQAGKVASTPAQQAELDANKEIARNTLGLLGYNEVPRSESFLNAAEAMDITGRARMNMPSGQNYSVAQMLGESADNVTPITDKQVRDDIDRAFNMEFNLYKSDRPHDFAFIGKQTPISNGVAVDMGNLSSGERAIMAPDAHVNKGVLDEAHLAMLEDEKNAELLARSQDAYAKKVAAIKSNPYLSAKWEKEAAGRGTGSFLKSALLGDAAGQGVPYVTGDITAGTLGTIEPVTKWSPWPVVQSIYGGDLKGAKRQMGAKREEYKNSSWYKKLKRANPQAAAAYDAVMKEKEEEE